ncbi:hypothetical protein AMTR_s00085p00167610 [Amborella trichopoda]|uniref:Uncharacterized protein n=1 Tax=Amborella trichopoda TaxID=13333 RepID=W1P493_AMBTC|nr:hypothetical protein AMTR_s00085p00167610 [Amborella trichopoda]
MAFVHFKAQTKQETLEMSRDGLWVDGVIWRGSGWGESHNPKRQQHVVSLDVRSTYLTFGMNW